MISLNLFTCIVKHKKFSLIQFHKLLGGKDMLTWDILCNEIHFYNDFLWKAIVRMQTSSSVGSNNCLWIRSCDRNFFKNTEETCVLLELFWHFREKRCNGNICFILNLYVWKTYFLLLIFIWRSNSISTITYEHIDFKLMIRQEKHIPLDKTAVYTVIT
jgi:hypothetical protein